MRKQDEVVFNAIRDNPGLYGRQVIALCRLSRRQGEDSIWALWSSGLIQENPNATLRVTNDGEKVFRHFAP